MSSTDALKLEVVVLKILRLLNDYFPKLKAIASLSNNPPDDEGCVTSPSP